MVAAVSVAAAGGVDCGLVRGWRLGGIRHGVGGGLGDVRMEDVIGIGVAGLGLGLLWQERRSEVQERQLLLFTCAFC